MRGIVVAALAILLSFPISAFAHSGGTDSNGCHTNHSTGSYHCHNDGDGGEMSTTSLLLLLGAAAVLTVGVIIFVNVNKKSAMASLDLPDDPGIKAEVKLSPAGVAAILEW